MFVLVRDGVEFWSTPCFEKGMPSLKDGECAPYEDGVLWSIPHDEFVGACDLNFEESGRETFTLKHWERVKGSSEASEDPEDSEDSEVFEDSEDSEVSESGVEMKFRLWQTGEFSSGELKNCTASELFEKWCEYEGLVHYSDRIINALKECGFRIDC